MDKIIDNNLIYRNEAQEFYQLQKKKHFIINKIIESIINYLSKASYYKNQDVNEKDYNFIKSQIGKFGQLGDDFFIQQQYEQALQCYELYINCNPNDRQNSLYYYKKGNSLSELKRYEEAITMYDKAIQLHLNSFYYYKKGNSLSKLKRSQEAIIMYDKAIQLDPYSTDYYEKGQSPLELKRNEKAIIMHDKAIQLDPQNSDNYYEKGNLLSELKRYQEAIIMYDKAIQLNPNKFLYCDKGLKYYISYYYYKKGNSLSESKRYEEAIIMYDNAIQLFPQNSHYYFQKGNLLSELMRYQEAIIMYDKAIQQDKFHFFNNLYKNSLINARISSMQSI